MGWYDDCKQPYLKHSLFIYWVMCELVKPEKNNIAKHVLEILDENQRNKY